MRYSPAVTSLRALFEARETRWKAYATIAADKALSLEPDLAEAHLARAYLFNFEEQNSFTFVKQAEAFRRALALNQSLDDAHHQLGSLYNHLGLLDKAADELQKAIAINPANTGVRYRIGINLLFQCKYEQAVTAFEGTRRFSPSLWGFHMALALFHLERKDEAAAVVNQSLRDVPHDEGGLLASMQAMLAAGAGDERRAEERISDALEGGKGYAHFHHTAYAVASAYALMKKHGAALKWLQTAADAGTLSGVSVVRCAWCGRVSVRDYDVVKPHRIGAARGGRIRETYDQRVNHTCCVWIYHRREVSKGVRQRRRHCKHRRGISQTSDCVRDWGRA